MAFSTMFAQKMTGALPSIFAKRAASDPSFLTKLAAKINASSVTAKVTGTASSIINWVKANPTNSILLATALSSLGVNVVNLVNGAEGGGGSEATPSLPATQSDLTILENIDREAARARAVATRAARANLLDYADNSEKADFGISKASRAAEDETAIAILGWAKMFFGSPEAAQKAHLALQAFFEMPYNDVVRGFEIYNLNRSR